MRYAVLIPVVIALLLLPSCFGSAASFARDQSTSQVADPASNTASVGAEPASADDATPGGLIVQPSGPTISNLTTNLADYADGRVPKYEKFEITFEVSGSYSNPFDPDEIQVDGHFVSPSGQKLAQPGFYYQDYQVSGIGDSETYTPVGDPVWKIRFAPKEVGTYQYHVQATDSSGTTTSSKRTFEVVDSGLPGFIRVSASNGRYFEYEDGGPFLGVGLNVGWWQWENYRISLYNYYLDRMNEYKANLARVWMTNSGTGHEWILSIQDTTLGDDYNLEEAWAFDQILSDTKSEKVASAKEMGVYFLLTLDDFNQYTYNWPDNLYNSALGGPCSNRCQIFTDGEAREKQEQVFRYIIARWGYSPNILSWEMFNEIDELQWSDPLCWDRGEMVNWHREIAQYIKSIDAHGHLVNTSTGSFKTHSDLYGLPEMELAQIHFYYVDGCCDYAPSDPAGRDMADLMRYYSYLVYTSVEDKPSVVGEWGLADEFWGPSPYLDMDGGGVHVHNGLWSSLMSGMAVAGLNWFWPEYQTHDPAWWEHYHPIGNYAEDIDINNLTVMRPANVSFCYPGHACPPDDRPEELFSSNDGLRAMGLRSGGRVYAWIQNRGHTWWNVVNGNPIPAVSGEIEIAGFQPGARYGVDWWDTYSGGTTSSETVVAQEDGSIVLSVNQLESDIAIKITPPTLPLLPSGYLPLIIKASE
jgi:hypothetical protein